MNQEIINHLTSRPIAPILHQQLSTHGENAIALKLMCIVDYCLDFKQLYPEILSSPKLFQQLFRFKDYGNFHFYEYKLPDFPFGEWLLTCQCCELIAPYKYTMEHMVLCHDRHLSAELCQWCGKNEIREHTRSDTLNQCYQKYYFGGMQVFAGVQISALIKNVFMQLRYLASKLGVRTYRSPNYRAIMSTVKETLDIGDADISDEVRVSKTPIRVAKTIKRDQLESLFQQALRYFGINLANVHYSPLTFGNYATRSEIRTTAQMFDTQQMPQIPQIHLTSTSPSSTPSQQQLPSVSSSISTPSYDPQSLEITNLANLLTSALKNMHDESIRKKALINIQRSILQYATEDLQSQIRNGTKDE